MRETGVSSRAGRDGGSPVTFADLLTIANGVCGLGIILVAAGLLRSGRHAVELNSATLVACGALLAAGSLFDVLDGAAAARWGSSGRGEKLDAMCDVITFAAAPATLLVASQTAGSVVARLAGILAAVILLAASLLRLSQSGADHHGGTYPGLTMPGAASAVVALLFLHAGAAVLLAGTVTVSALLLSRVPYPAFGPRVAPLLVSVWVLAVLGLTGVLPMWPFAILMLACLPLAPILARPSRDGALPRGFAGMLHDAQAKPSAVTPARTRSPTLTDGSMPAGITTATREPNRIIPIRSPLATRSPTRR